MEFDSAEYSWVDIELFMLGRKVTGLRGIKYKSSQEKELVHASGNEARTIGRGNIKCEGSIKLLQSEVQALEAAAGKGKDVYHLRRLTIVVAYAPKDGGQISTDIIENAEFTESEKGMDQGAKFGEISLPFLALGIKKNV